MIEQGKERLETPHFRQMTLSDVPVVCALGNNAAEFMVSSDVRFWTEAELSGWIRENRDDVLLVAEVQEKLAGFVLAKYHVPTKVGTFVDTFVQEQFRRQGIGKALEQEAIRQLKEKGARYIYGLVQTGNTASIALQESLGFKQGETFVWMELRDNY